MWELVLPKNESFDGETLHEINTGGGAAKLQGMSASVSCELSQIGTKRLDGEFKLLFANDGNIQSTVPISAYNDTNDEIKAALEALPGIDRVEVNSASFDTNNTGNGAPEWHVTTDRLRNAGDILLLTADYTSLDSNLIGTNAAINIKETRKGTSYPITIFDGIE